MKILRKIVLFFTVLAFTGLLYATAGAWTINHTVARKDTVKSWLRESGAYDHFVDEIVRLAKDKQAKDASTPGAVDNGGVNDFSVADLQTAAEKTFTPTFLSTNIEKVLDGTYAWLDGSSPQLNFSLDLSEAKKNFAAELGNTALAKAATLPPCTTFPENGEFDPLSAACIPAGVDVKSEVAKFVTNFQTSPDILPDPVVSADQLKIEKDGRSQRIDQAFSSAPKYYQLGKNAAFVITGLTVLWGLFVFLLGSTRRYGLKHIAKALLFVSLTLLATSLLLRPLTNTLNDALVKKNNQASSFSQQIALPLVQKVNDSNKEWGMVFAAIYGFIGFAIVIFLLATKKHTHPTDTATDHPADTPHHDAPKPDANVHPESVVAQKTDKPKGPPPMKPGGKSISG